MTHSSRVALRQWLADCVLILTIPVKKLTKVERKTALLHNQSPGTGHSQPAWTTMQGEKSISTGSWGWVVRWDYILWIQGLFLECAIKCIPHQPLPCSSDRRHAVTQPPLYVRTCAVRLPDFCCLDKSWRSQKLLPNGNLHSSYVALCVGTE